MNGNIPLNNDVSTIFALGFSFWKKPILRCFFPDSRLIFTNRPEVVPEGATVIIWGLDSPEMRSLPENIQFLHIEDGFLRSVGLGADLIRPISWVVDSRGMYFDSRFPSDLETLLLETEFSEDIIARADKLRHHIINKQLTKYNVFSKPWHRPPDIFRVILVPGQVESDASIRYGAPDIKSNLDLLKTVRQENPDAYIIYKPHPDVVAGLRAKGHDEDNSKNYCDEYLPDVSMGHLLEVVDEVHVMTSLAGFEALLRRKKVFCYGQPFYAGWGLTIDKLPLDRRDRQLSIDELIAGCLILYPQYIHPKTGALVSPETAIDALLAWRKRTSPDTPWWRKIFRIILRRCVGVR